MTYMFKTLPQYTQNKIQHRERPLCYGRDRTQFLILPLRNEHMTN
jgi:hypothetical protein